MIWTTILITPVVFEKKSRQVLRHTTGTRNSIQQKIIKKIMSPLFFIYSGDFIGLNLKFLWTDRQTNGQTDNEEVIP